MNNKKLLKYSKKWVFAIVVAFVLSIAVGKEMPVFANTTTTTTTNVVFDKQYSGSTEAYKVDKYNITLPQAGRITINIESTGWHSWELVDSGFEEIDSKGKTGGDRWIYDLTAGTYQLSIGQDYNHNLATYTVSVHFEPANETYTYENNMYIDVASQAAIPFNQKITGQLAVNDTLDYYKLIVPATGKVNFSLITDASEVRLTINNSQNEVLKTAYFRKAGLNVSYTLTEGTYYLCFSNVYNSTGVYNYTASYEIDAPTGVTAQAASYKALKVTAQKSGNITGYHIRYKKNSGSWNEVTVAGNNNLSKTLAVTPGTYEVQVRTYCTVSGVTYYSQWSETKKATCQISTPTNIKVKNSSSKAIKVTAKKKGTIAGYTVRYKKGSGSWRNVTVKGNKKLNKTIKKMNVGSTYKVQVRAYCKISGKTYYSAWSKTQKIKIKK